MTIDADALHNALDHSESEAWEYLSEEEQRLIIAAARAHLATLEPHDWQPALYEDGEPAPFNQCARCKQVSYAPVIAPCSAHLATLEGCRRHTVEEIRDCWLSNRGADGSDWESALTAVYDLALATPVEARGERRRATDCRCEEYKALLRVMLSTQQAAEQSAQAMRDLGITDDEKGGG